MSRPNRPTKLMREAIDIALRDGNGKLRRGEGGIWTPGGNPVEQTPRQHGFLDNTVRSLVNWGFARATDFDGGRYMIEVEVVRENLRNGVGPEMMDVLHELERHVRLVEVNGLAGKIESQDDARALLRRYGMEPP